MIEKTILQHLVYNEKYVRAVLHHLSPEYFSDQNERLVFKHIEKFYKKYNSPPSQEALFIELSRDDGLNENTFNSTKAIVSGLTKPDEINEKWLLDQTEQFCKDREVYNAIHKAIKIYDNKLTDSVGKIPQLLEDAIGKSFDNHVGHDFIDDALSRFEKYNKKDSRIDFNLYYFNQITRGGLPGKTFNIIIAPTGAGKTLVMCNMAAHNLISNKNVLYITMEMAEEAIAQRIDQNLLDLTADQLLHLSKFEYEKKLEKLRLTTKGKLVIKEYPTSSAHAGHFRHLLNELKLKKKFIPDIIYIDYVNICASSRVKLSGDSYGYVKAIAEELRGLAIEFNLPIVSATQSNRDSFSASDFDLKNTSESIGLPQTADFMIALIVTEELDELGQVMFKQLKNRYNDPNLNRRFVVGIDRAKMRLYDVEQSAQENIMDGPVMDKSKFMEEETERVKVDRTKFKGFR